MSRQSAVVLLAALAALATLVCAFAPAISYGARADVPIVPRPAMAERGKGSFLLTSATRIVVVGQSARLGEIAGYASERIKEQTGISLAVKGVAEPAGRRNAIVLQLCRDDGGLGPEGYRVVVSPKLVLIEAPAETGVFYGIQSLRQLCVGRGRSVKIPAVVIEDRPRFRWRGAHLDVSRHFFTIEFVKEYIDILALHKINMFHWHLTDDQGWRIEIKRYPKLTEVGAWRVDREDRGWTNRPPQMPGERATYGGYYTQSEIKEVVEYAKSRCVAIVPEIEMPAHTTAVLAAYPQYSCTGGPFTVPPGDVWPISDIYCAGNDSTFTFIENILDEVMQMFPGEFIHIGGDEADKTEWRKCRRCQARIRDEGLKDEGELQSYFVKRIEAFLRAHGKRLLGWDEILEGGIPAEAAVMSWRGMEGGIAAARQGHDVVMTPGSHCYFDHYQGPRASEPLAIGGYTPLGKVYSFEPVPDSLTVEEAKHVLGAQANLWTEYIPTPEHAEYMLLPRLAALAEVVWSPVSLRDWRDFVPRMEHLMKTYDRHNYAMSAYLVSITTAADSVAGRASVSLATEMGTPVIRYTLDGTDPTHGSRRYEKPFVMDTSGIIKAAAFVGRRSLGHVTEQPLIIHNAFYKPVVLAHPYGRYTGGGKNALTDGIRGGKSHDDGKWQGFEFDDVDAVIDLGAVQNVSRISAGFLQDTYFWIFLPKTIEYSISEDGVNYTAVGKYEVPIATEHGGTSISEIKLELKGAHARYVRVSANNVGLCPEWHDGKGQKAWVFIDEITIE